jgi:hypothetical protein
LNFQILIRILYVSAFSFRCHGIENPVSPNEFHILMTTNILDVIRLNNVNRETSKNRSANYPTEAISMKFL